MKRDEDVDFMSGLELVSTGTPSEMSEITDIKEDQQPNPIDDTNFAPDRVLYILPSNLFSKEIRIIDITSAVLDGMRPYRGGDIDNALRTRARALAKTNGNSPLYTVERRHWYSRESTMYVSGPLPAPTMENKDADDNNNNNKIKNNKGAQKSSSSSSSNRTALCHWHQPPISCGRATLRFPPGSPHSSHALELTHPCWYRRTNVWVQDSVGYDWMCDRKLRSNRMTLHRRAAGRWHEVGARYSQRWGGWIAGGVLLVDTRVVDEVVAVQTAVVMLRRMQQRTIENAKYSGGA